ncbi:predicted protein [Sclerotinia sclerotiorum 1980 UF-70]|uniref:Uncharacterized protein n=1 Tax=Sclerotinia sclerotiorum (strain ATCC 18683 / 1980 / Ss-1) TaxID=665079 RepID=A7F3J9_SCLS1|nr:predicted protein [Sclerotinia sclerotiorum 1980 UF-70]EDN97320.1 predicted protein [Sclerotinia sclerotiorum 1980 UF-70]
MLLLTIGNGLIKLRSVEHLWKFQMMHAKIRGSGLDTKYDWKYENHQTLISKAGEYIAIDIAIDIDIDANQKLSCNSDSKDSKIAKALKTFYLFDSRLVSKHSNLSDIRGIGIKAFFIDECENR